LAVSGRRMHPRILALGWLSTPPHVPSLAPGSILSHTAQVAMGLASCTRV
jgi:hypothetical protein